MAVNSFEAKASELLAQIKVEAVPGVELARVRPCRRRVVRSFMRLTDFLSVYDAQHYLASLENGFTDFTDELNELSFLEAQLGIEPEYDVEGNRVYDLAVLMLMQTRMAA